MLDEFLNKNGNLFTALAFFIALAGYFLSLSSNSEPEISSVLRIGIVSCIVISILISLIILKKLFQDPVGKQLSPSLDLNIENIERFVFVIPFLLTVLTFFYYISHVFNLEMNVIIGTIGAVVSVALYLQMFKIKFFKEHLYIGSILIIVVSVVIEYYILPYKNNPSFIPLYLALSSFVNMSILILIITLICDAKKKVTDFLVKITP